MTGWLWWRAGACDCLFISTILNATQFLNRDCMTAKGRLNFCENIVNFKRDFDWRLAVISLFFISLALKAPVFGAYIFRVIDSCAQVLLSLSNERTFLKLCK